MAAKVTSKMNEIDLIKLKNCYPGRNNQIDQLLQCFGNKDEPYPSSVFICGGPSTGKTSIVTSLFKLLKIKYATINLIECYSTRILLESVLNQLMDHKIDPHIGAPYAKCESLMSFVSQIERISLDKPGYLDGSVIVLDKAEELRDMEMNLLPSFLSLQELTGVKVTVVFLSDIVYEKYFYRLNVVEPIKLHFPQYNKEQFMQILLKDFNYVAKLIKNKLDLDIDGDLYESYLNLFLSVFYQKCRDLQELRHMNQKIFPTYCEPIAKKLLTSKDSLTLWKMISPIFSSSLEFLYLRISDTPQRISNHFSLPYYGRYLLVAAYLASYNSPKDDKRLFTKHHGKKMKTARDIKQKSKISEQLNVQIGPKPFTLDRLLAIFYAILDNKVGFNNHLLVQVSSLVKLQLLSLVSEESNLDGTKYKCTVSFEVIQDVSSRMGLNIRKYLNDFSHIWVFKYNFFKYFGLFFLGKGNLPRRTK